MKLATVHSSVKCLRLPPSCRLTVIAGSSVLSDPCRRNWLPVSASLTDHLAIAGRKLDGECTVGRCYKCTGRTEMKKGQPAKGKKQLSSVSGNLNTASSDANFTVSRPKIWRHYRCEDLLPVSVETVTTVHSFSDNFGHTVRTDKRQVTRSGSRTQDLECVRLT